VSPSVSIVAAPLGAREVNRTVMVTCRVLGFYPGAVNVTWLLNGTELTGSTPQPTETPQGLFDLRSTVTVPVAENSLTFSCRVMHEGKEKTSKVTYGHTTNGPEGPSSCCTAENSAGLLASPGLWLGLLLDKVLVALVLFFLFKRCLP
ncbi:HA11 protein, partial [Penelope pileata]|nr:HA11 protein [Penelope pileata]